MGEAVRGVAVSLIGTALVAGVVILSKGRRSQEWVLTVTFSGEDSA